MKKIGIFIGSEQKGFLTALAYQFEKMHNSKTTIFARDKYVVNVANKILPSDYEVEIVDCSNLSIKVDTDLVFKEAKRIEKMYGIKLSILLSDDRALGQGYLSNVQKIPDIKRAHWSHRKKIEIFVNDFLQKENMLNKLDIVIQMFPNKIVTAICKKHNIHFLSFTSIKFGDRMFWSDNDFLSGSLYVERLKKYLYDSKDKSIVEYHIDKDGDNFNKSAKYSYNVAIKSAIEIIINDSKKFIRRNNKKDSYHYLGWVPSVFRRISNYNYVKSKSVVLNDLTSYKIVFFTLHLEPEVALQYFSPEFSNSMEAITWISKSLPVNYILVVKEQVASYGVRSRWYYRQLIKIPNVVLSHPDVHSWDWIEASSMIGTITGTVGQEAIHFEKPVLSFGKHQVINYLPTVYYVSNYFETNAAIEEIINKPPTKALYKKSRIAFSNAQVDSSIDMPKYKSTFRLTKLETKMASEAIKHLFSEYPGSLIE